MITCKLGNMRKAVEWSVYPPGRMDDSNRLLIQCDKRIALIDIEKKKVILSSGKGGHPGFHALNPRLGAKLYDCPQEVIDAAKEAQPQPGDTIGNGSIRLVIA